MIEKTFLNPTTNKQWRIEIDGKTIRTCLNGGKAKEIPVSYTHLDVYKRQEQGRCGAVQPASQPDAVPRKKRRSLWRGTW